MSAYKIHDYEAIETRDLPKVRFTVDVDNASLERCYRVRGIYDVAEESFDELAVTEAWSNDLEERALTPSEAPAAREIARFVECEPDFVDLLHREAKREMRATDPR